MNHILMPRTDCGKSKSICELLEAAPPWEADSGIAQEMHFERPAENAAFMGCRSIPATLGFVFCGKSFCHLDG